MVAATVRNILSSRSLKVSFMAWPATKIAVPMGSAPPASEGTLPMTTNDEHLRAEIRKALDDDRRIAGSGPDVSVSNHIVTLAGSTRSQRSMLAAVEIAASFPGCRGVVNRQVLVDDEELWERERLWELCSGDGILRVPTES